jgi:beta-xylosidase
VCRNIKIMLLMLPPLLLSATLCEGCDKTYSNPVLVETYSLNRSKPEQYVGILGIGDPAVIFHEGKYYLYPTGDNYSYDVYISDDLVHWARGPKIFQTREIGVWAPDVFFNRDDRIFYLYYTVNGRIGVATSVRPDGTFEDRGILIHDAIDAHMFRDDDGSYFLYYARYPEFGIFVQPMENPVRRLGEPIQIISPSEDWEMTTAPVTEAPWMLKYKGVYYLLYSGGSADSEYYAIGYATAQNPAGPFTKHRENPIIRKGDGIFGPGHASVTRDREGKLWMVYHQKKDATKGWHRIICIDPLRFDDKGVLHGKATRANPRPSPAKAGD